MTIPSIPPPLPTPTPRTDEVFLASMDPVVSAQIALERMEAHARQLERDLSDAKALFRDQAKHLHDELLSEKRELVEALREAIVLANKRDEQWQEPTDAEKLNKFNALLTRLSAKGGTV